jgi:hypothetical protein
LHNITVGRLFENTAAQFPSRAAVETPSGVFDYSAIDKFTDDSAGKMLKLGISRGTHIGIWSKDMPYSLFIYLCGRKDRRCAGSLQYKPD